LNAITLTKPTAQSAEMYSVHMIVHSISILPQGNFRGSK